MDEMVSVYCPTCGFEDYLNPAEVNDSLRCVYCQVLLAEFQDLTQRQRVRVLNR